MLTGLIEPDPGLLEKPREFAAESRSVPISVVRASFRSQAELLSASREAQSPSGLASPTIWTQVIGSQRRYPSLPATIKSAWT